MQDARSAASFERRNIEKESAARTIRMAIATRSSTRVKPSRRVLAAFFGRNIMMGEGTCICRRRKEQLKDSGGERNRADASGTVVCFRQRVDDADFVTARNLEYLVPGDPCVWKASCSSSACPTNPKRILVSARRIRGGGRLSHGADGENCAKGEGMRRNWAALSLRHVDPGSGAWTGSECLVAWSAC